MIQTLEWPPSGWGQGIVGSGCCQPDWASRLRDLTPKHDFHYDIEMPGVKRENISVKAKGGNVTVVWTSHLGETKTQMLPIGTKYYEMEKLSVTYADGLLKIHCPLKPEFPPDPPQEPEIDIEIK